MDPRLDEQERGVREAARAALAAAAGPAVAASIDERREVAPEVLSALRGPAVLGCCAAAEHGGGGGGATELALVVEEVGRASASLASIVAGHVVAGLVIAAAGGEAAAAWLAEIGDGKRLAALALNGGGSIFDDPRPAARLARDGNSGSLSGRIEAVPGATVADLFVVPALAAGDGSLAGWAVVQAASGNVEVGAEEAKLGLNGSGLAAVELDGAEVSGTALFGAGAPGVELLERAVDWSRLAYAAVCVGVAEAALEVARARVKASSEDLESAQSVQWMLADSATEAEAARLLTWYAASRVLPGELREAAAMARLLGTEAAVRASRRAVQIYGRDGSSRSAGVERLYRDAKALEVHHGASEAQRLAVARRLLPDLIES